MTATPKRRWFQLRLGPWFILIGIAAWAMALRPKLGYWHEVESYGTGADGWEVGALSIYENSTSQWAFTLYPRALICPVTAALLFACWKLVWRVVDRRRWALTLPDTTPARVDPKRRWFQFRPGTWLMLIGVAAWIMALRPEFNYEHAVVPHGLRPGGWEVGVLSVYENSSSYWAFTLYPRALTWPVMAALSFACWKLVRRIVDLRQPAAESYAATPPLPRA